MSPLKHILFVNHREKNCGVNQMGHRYFRNMEESQKYIVHYIDVPDQATFDHWFLDLRPSAIVWNFYSGATMPWLSNGLISVIKPHAKQLGIYHELPIENKGFDLILHQDPSSTDAFPHWNLPRSIPRFNYLYGDREIPTFGSFGFGLGGKGFARLVTMVNEQFDHARIHLHIPFAHFGDEQGISAMAHAHDARLANKKPYVELTIDHDFWEEDHLLSWLAMNTCNCFLYDPHHGRGISGTLDYALAVHKPIAITRSEQFKHVWSIDSSFTVEENNLHKIIEMGAAPTDKFREMWSREAFVKSFEDALESLGV